MFKLNKKTKEGIDFFFLKLVPAFTIAAILLFYVIISFYYDFYGIEIIHYMDGSEILFSFLPFFKISILPITLIYLMLRFLEKYLYPQKWYLKWSVGTLLVIVCSFGPFWFYSESQGNAFGLFVSLSGFILFILSSRNDKFSKEAKAANMRIMFIILLLLVAITFSAYYMNKLSKTNHGINEIHVIFEVNGKKARTNSDTVYIGQTRNYLFFLNRRDGQTLVFKKDEINNLTIIKR